MLCFQGAACNRFIKERCKQAGACVVQVSCIPEIPSVLNGQIFFPDQIKIIEFQPIFFGQRSDLPDIAVISLGTHKLKIMDGRDKECKRQIFFPATGNEFAKPVFACFPQRMFFQNHRLKKEMIFVREFHGGKVVALFQVFVVAPFAQIQMIPVCTVSIFPLFCDV